MDMNEEVAFGYYMVGVFDILGQSQKLRKQTKIPLDDDPVEKQRVIDNLKETAGVVIGLRCRFKQFFDAASQPTGRADSLPEPQRTEMLAAMESKVLLRGVSDAIFVAVPLTSEPHPAARVHGVSDSLMAAGCMWLLGLSTNDPIRGGMEIGTGIELESGEIYGQCLEAAYHLESQVARYPRVVVGPKCVEFLNDVKRGEHASEIRLKIAANAADLSLSMLRKDTDGHTVVDGLGQTMLDHSRKMPDPGLLDQFSKAYGNVRTQCLDFRAAGDVKLASRYETLREYFDERASMWQSTPRTQ